MKFNYFKIRECVNNIPASDKLNGKRVLFVTIRSFSFIFFQELFFANVYARQGAKVKVLLDDGLLPHWDSYQLPDKKEILNPYKNFKIRLVKFYLLRAFSHPNISIIYLSSLISESTLKQARADINEQDKKDCISSVRRYFQNGRADLTDPVQKKYYDASIENCVIMKTAINRIIEDWNPTLAITSHGIYSLWGPGYTILKKQSIPTYVYGPHPYQPDCFDITDTLIQTLCRDSDAVDYMKNGVFTEENKKEIQEFFDKRQNHKTIDTAIYYSWMDKEKADTSFFDKKDESVTTFCMFPNVIWDGDVAQRDKVFDGNLDYIISTINSFRNSKNFLYVRCHPSEATLCVNDIKLIDVLEKEIPDLYELKNVKIIRSEWKIDTYDFIRNYVDVGIVYDGIIAMELTYLGKPVISPSMARFNGGDFLINPDTREEYFALFDNTDYLKSFINPDRINAMLKFAYWYIYKLAYYMPIYSTKVWLTCDFNKDFKHEMSSERFVRSFNKLISIAI